MREQLIGRRTVRSTQRGCLRSARTYCKPHRRTLRGTACCVYAEHGGKYYLSVIEDSAQQMHRSTRTRTHTHTRTLHGVLQQRYQGDTQEIIVTHLIATQKQSLALDSTVTRPPNNTPQDKNPHSSALSNSMSSTHQQNRHKHTHTQPHTTSLCRRKLALPELLPQFFLQTYYTCPSRLFFFSFFFFLSIQ